jgi:hypothetical protein
MAGSAIAAAPKVTEVTSSAANSTNIAAASQYHY